MRPCVDEIATRFCTEKEIEISLTHKWMFSLLRVEGYTGDYTNHYNLPSTLKVPEYFYRHIGQPQDRDWTVESPFCNGVVCLTSSMVWEGVFSVPSLDKNPYLFTAQFQGERNQSRQWQFGHRTVKSDSASAIGNGVYALANDYQKRRVLDPLYSSNSLVTSWELFGRKEKVYYAVAGKVISTIQEKLLKQERTRQVETGELNGEDHPLTAALAVRAKVKRFVERQQEMYVSELDELIKRYGLASKMLPKVAYENIKLVGLTNNIKDDNITSSD